MHSSLNCQNLGSLNTHTNLFNLGSHSNTFKRCIFMPLTFIKDHFRGEVHEIHSCIAVKMLGLWFARYVFSASPVNPERNSFKFQLKGKLIMTCIFLSNKKYYVTHCFQIALFKICSQRKPWVQREVIYQTCKKQYLSGKRKRRFPN